MIRVAIVGYYGFGNIGDEWLCEASVAWVRGAFPKAHLTIFSTRSVYEKGIRFINRWSVGEVWKTIRNSDRVILGGGTLFQDTTSFRSVLYYAGIVFLAKLYEVPVIGLGQGLEKMEWPLSEVLTRWALNQCRVLGFRGKRSQRQAAELGVTAPSILTADLAYGALSFPKTGPAGQWIGISLCPSRYLKPEMPQYGYMMQVLRTLVTPKDCFLSYFPVQDDPCIRHFKEALNIPAESYDMSRGIGKCPTFKWMLVMRYHAAVYASLSGIPFIALAVHEKLVELAEELGQPVVDLRNPAFTHHDILNTLKSFLKEYAQYQSILQERIEELKKRGVRHARLVRT